MLDDMTRFVLHGGFYASLDKSIVTDCFRQAVQKCGVPETIYFHNGKQYRSKWMARTCSKLGVRLLFTKVYSPEAKGNEKFNRTVDSFLSEAAIEKPQTLERLREWADDYRHAHTAACSSIGINRFAADCECVCSSSGTTKDEAQKPCRAQHSGGVGGSD